MDIQIQITSQMESEYVDRERIELKNTITL